MLEIIKAGGWVMWPIIAGSVIALAIIIERFWTLRPSAIIPAGLAARTWQQVREGKLDKEQLAALREGSPLGFVLAAAVANVRLGREAMREQVDIAGALVVSEMERFLAVLGAIASVATLLGLLGSVVGMIEIFNSVSATGGETSAMTHGIAMALVATAGGLTVAIPSQFFYRILMRRVDVLSVQLEQESVRFVQLLGAADRGDRSDRGEAARDAA